MNSRVEQFREDLKQLLQRQCERIPVREQDERLSHQPGLTAQEAVAVARDEIEQYERRWC